MTDKKDEIRYWTEAPASWNVRYIMNGYDCMLTLRDESASELIKRTVSAIDWLREHDGEPTRVSAPSLAQPAPAPAGPPTPPQPQYEQDPWSQPDPAEPEPEEVIQVKTIAHKQTDNGQPYLLVKGGKYSKFGVKCWPECVPEVAKAYETWALGQEFAPLPGMNNAHIQGKKVVRFS